MAWQLTLLAAIRVSTFVWIAPLLGNHRIPWWIRAVTAVLVSLALAPLAVNSHALAGATVLDGGELFSRGLSELMTGLMLGLGVSVLVGAATMAGQILSQMSGISWPISDSEASSPVTQLVWMVSLVVFVLMRGPELMLGALAGTLQTLPPGTTMAAGAQIAFVTELLTHSFWLTLRGVAPAVAALWIAMLGVTILVRVLPQAGCLQLGMDAGLAAFWLAVLVTVCGGVWIWMDDLESWMNLLQQRLIAAAGQAPVETPAMSSIINR